MVALVHRAPNGLNPVGFRGFSGGSRCRLGCKVSVVVAPRLAMLGNPTKSSVRKPDRDRLSSPDDSQAGWGMARRGGQDGRAGSQTRDGLLFLRRAENCHTPEISRCIVTCSPGTMNNPG
jgi:hypothetical protein